MEVGSEWECQAQLHTEFVKTGLQVSLVPEFGLAQYQRMKSKRTRKF